jgi:hypothetical protein
MEQVEQIERNHSKTEGIDHKSVSFNRVGISPIGR